MNGHGAIRVGEDPDGDRLDPYTRALEVEIGRLNAEIAEAERYKRALQSIANSACCGCCQEAALVAQHALGPQETAP